MSNRTGSRLHRRDWMRNGIGGVGLGLCGTSWVSQLAAQMNRSARDLDKSVVVIWLNGGPATIDLWDLKEDHENGGPFRSIATRTEGMRISEHFSQLADWSSEIALLRSLVSNEGDHGRASHFLRTGYKPMGAIQFPALGALIAHELTMRSNGLPGYISIAPSRNQAVLDGGFFGPRYSPLKIGHGAETAADLIVNDLHRPDRLATGEVAEREWLLELVEGKTRKEQSGSVVSGLQASTEAALELMRPEAASLFDLGKEPEETRQRYGQNLFGQGCLLARRLVEQRVPCVEVMLDGWDTHQDNFNRVANLSRTLDQAMSALFSDLHERGLLSSTLIVCMGEFGRTPKINRNTGRDHWPHGWSALLAGAVPGGQVIGATSRDGTEVIDRPVQVPDFLATLFKSLGVDPQKQNDSNVGRPIRVADPEAKIVEELIV